MMVWFNYSSINNAIVVRFNNDLIRFNNAIMVWLPHFHELKQMTWPHPSYFIYLVGKHENVTWKIVFLKRYEKVFKRKGNIFFSEEKLFPTPRLKPQIRSILTQMSFMLVCFSAPYLFCTSGVLT